MFFAGILSVEADTANVASNAKHANDTTGEAISEITSDDSSVNPDTLSSVVASDGVYTVDKNAVMQFTTFDVSGITGGSTVAGAVLHLQYGAENGYNGANAVRYDNGAGLINTSITPTDITGFSADQTFDLFSAGVDTISEIQNLDIEFTSNDGASADAIHFDYLWITVTFTPPPAPVTTIGDGTDPGNVTLAPGDSVTDLDSFTLQTNTGTDTVTAATVTLSSGSSGGLSLVAITNDAGSTTYCSQSDPSSDAVSLTSCGIPLTSSQTQFKIRITPKTHANMLAPSGSTYTVTGTITAFTSTNSQSGSDIDSATVTIDNSSPANVTSASGTAGDTQVSLSWTNPVDSDFHSTVVLRRENSAVADTPVEGTTYIVGNTIGTATIACIVVSPTASCIDTGLTNGAAYHYKIFSKDTNINYAAGVVPTGSPFTPAADAPAPEPAPPAAEPASAAQPAGPTARVIKVTFSGQAYPGAKIEILRKDTSLEDAPYLTVPLETHKVSEDGTFNLEPGALLADEYFFALRAEDKDGRKTRILPFPVDLRTTDKLEVKDILMPPTLDFEKTRIRKGDSLKIIGYATPGSKTEIEINGKIKSAVSPQKTGYYSFTTTTREFAFGNHYVRTRQIDGKGRASNFSTTRTFQVSQLLAPKADFNQDNIINVTDWSIFLFRWGSKDEKTRLTVDMNNDGKIDIRDFSIFLRTLSL